MVAISIILAAVIAAFVFCMGDDTESTPLASIVVLNSADTPGFDLKVVHKGGNMLIGGGWKLSVVPAGQSPVFIGANSTSEFGAGQQFYIANTTIGASNLTNNGFDGGGPLMRGSRYDVKFIEYPSEALLFDDVIEVR